MTDYFKSIRSVHKGLSVLSKSEHFYKFMVFTFIKYILTFLWITEDKSQKVKNIDNLLYKFVEKDWVPPEHIEMYSKEFSEFFLSTIQGGFSEKLFDGNEIITQLRRIQQMAMHLIGEFKAHIVDEYHEKMVHVDAGEALEMLTNECESIVSKLNFVESATILITRIARELLMDVKYTPNSNPECGDAKCLNAFIASLGVRPIGSFRDSFFNFMKTIYES